MAFFFRKLLKGFGVRANAYPFNSVEFNRNVDCCWDLEKQDGGACGCFKFVSLKFCLRRQFLLEPTFNFLLFVFCSKKMHMSPDNIVGLIVYTIDKIATLFVKKGC